MFNVPRITLAAPHRSCGKTTTAVGLCRAFSRRGLTVQPFKKGPDYIDPMWMTAAAGRDCRNLDFHMMGDENILRALESATGDADIAIVEGNLGLYDGMDLEGHDSTAGLAHLIESPLILVIDSWGMNRGVAALLVGYRNFDPELNIAGVILNRVSSPRHESKLRKAIEHYSDVPIVGILPKAPEKVGVTERHLGLIPVKEDPKLLEKIEAIGELTENNIDLDRILEIAATATELPDVEPCPQPSGEKDIKIGVAMDRAFTFYYPENLEALESAGAEIVPFSPLSDQRLPEVDGLYLGGGFPEVFIKELEANKSLRVQIKTEIDKGLPVYAECGGMMYLANTITWKDVTGEMVGAIDCGVEMTKKPAGLGYMTLEATGACKWLNPKGPVHCHEFHHSRLTGLDENMSYAWTTLRGSGVNENVDGIVVKNVLASYAHLHACGAPTWAVGFAEFIRETGIRISAS